MIHGPDFLAGLMAGVAVSMLSFHLTRGLGRRAGEREHEAYQRGLKRAHQAGEHVHCEPGPEPPPKA